MPPISLDILKKNREALWLAEMGAWLNNVGKLSTAFQQRPRDFHLKGIVGRLVTQWPDCQRVFSAWADGWKLPIAVGGQFNDLGDLVLGDFIEERPCNLVELLKACHEAASGSEKENIPTGAQANGRISSPFGYAGQPRDMSGLDAERDSKLLPAVLAKDRRKFVEVAQQVMSVALADTQWPINDITLWDFSSAVAAFFKAALAKCVLEGNYPGKPKLARNFAWRLLRVGINGPDFYGRVARLPDLLARKELMRDLLDATRPSLEEELSLANEIYRDEHGSIFLVPVFNDDEDGARLKDALQHELKQVWQRTGIEDVVPRLDVGAFVAEGVIPVGNGNPDRDRIVGKALKLMRDPDLHTPKPLKGDPVKVDEWWKGRRADVCPVCGLRPQDSNSRKVCHTCEIRRAHRSKEWYSEKLGSTIWLEEVADRNGRIAIVCGRFHLDDWLAAQPDAWGGMPASFARIRRVWDTTHRFWQEIEEEAANSVSKGGPRIRLHGQFYRQGDNSLGPSRAFLLEKDGIRFSFVCTGHGEFLSAENLERAAILAGAAEHKISSPDAGADYLLKDWPRHTKFNVEEPTGYGSPNRKLGYFQIDLASQETQTQPYQRVIGISSDPRSFHLLTPASCALNVAALVEQKYATEFAKVRQRLPIQLGVVYAQAATPLYALLDAARRMSRRPQVVGEWQVAARQNIDHSDEIRFANGAAWSVPRVFDDGSADDWHPKFQVPFGTDENREPEWPLAKALEAGQTVRVAESTFDFEFLDTAGRRFEIAYTQKGRRSRRLPQPGKPFPLHRLADIRNVWAILDRGLNRAQIHAMHGLLLDKAQTWQDSDVLQSFSITVLEASQWHARPNPEAWETLHNAVKENYLLDAIDLHLGIMKLKQEAESEQEAAITP